MDWVWYMRIKNDSRFFWLEQLGVWDLLLSKMRKAVGGAILRSNLGHASLEVACYCGGSLLLQLLFSQHLPFLWHCFFISAP